MAETAAPTFAHRLAAEALGTAFLLMSIVGPGILAMKTSGGNVAISILAITGAVFLTLAALIAIFMPISGAHFNPCVTLMVSWHGDLKWREAPGYIAAQILGGTAGVALADTERAQPQPEVVRVDIEAGRYLVFTGQGEMPQMVVDTWMRVWNYFADNPQVQRRFGTDFEAYERPDQVAVHVGVQ